MAIEEDEIVMVRASGSGRASKTVYHTDPDCPRIEMMGKVMEKPLSVLPSDIRECDYCSGEFEPNHPGEQSHLNALKAAAESEGG